ncbi:MAG: archaeosortase/exosortase family protein [Candidatus Diapherotrites archaeon]|nr:archaeosortase/exosortase family protein [Candidatus Diapherotrites archaeon]
MVRFDEFFAVFLASFSVLYVFFHVVDLLLLKEVVARASVLALNALGQSASLSGVVVQSAGLSFAVVTSCTGAVSFSIFAGLIAATPMKNKAVYAVMAFPVFMLENVARITLTLMSGQSYQLMHNAAWMLSVLVVLSLYMTVIGVERVRLWGDGRSLKKERKHKRKR